VIGKTPLRHPRAAKPLQKTRFSNFAVLWPFSTYLGKICPVFGKKRPFLIKIVKSALLEVDERKGEIFLETESHFP